MGYNIEISINMLKEKKFSEVENTIQCVAKIYNCNDIYNLYSPSVTVTCPPNLCPIIKNEE